MIQVPGANDAENLPSSNESAAADKTASEKSADISEETAMEDPSLPNRNIGKAEWDRDDLKKHKKNQPGSAETY